MGAGNSRVVQAIPHLMKLPRRSSARLQSRWGMVPLAFLLLGLPVFLPAGGEEGRHDCGPSCASTIEVSGWVVDTAGSGVRSARIQLVDELGVLGSTTSEPSGFFRMVGSREPVGSIHLRVDRLGYEPAETMLDARPRQEVRIELTAAPIPLPGVEVFAESPICSSSDARALELWERAADRHRLDLDTFGVATYTLARTDTLAAGAILSASDPEVGLDEGQRGSASLLRFSWTRRVEREGYAFPVRRTNRSGSYDSWSYAPLEADFAEHFLSPAFLRWNHLQRLDPRGSGGYDLHFCPADEDRPSIRGRLSLSPDTLLILAEWEFLTPEPGEDAGGWTRFEASGDPEPPRLLPSESLTWKSLPDGTIQRRAHWYEGWLLAPGDSVPFLPRR